MVVPPRQAGQMMPRMGRDGDVKTHSMSISRVALRGFKGHKSLDLDMGRITVLIGPQTRASPPCSKPSICSNPPLKMTAGSWREVRVKALENLQT